MDGRHLLYGFVDEEVGNDVDGKEGQHKKNTERSA